MTDKEFDEGLKAVMGDRFNDETESHTVKHTAKPVEQKQSKPVKTTTKKEKPANAEWEPVESQWEPEKPAPNWMDKLKQTAKDMCLWAVISLVLFYWQQTGRIDVTTSWYALLVCVGMVFFSIGKNCRGGK